MASVSMSMPITPTTTTYPCLTSDSIHARCISDLEKFKKLYGFDVSDYNLPSDPAVTVDELKSRIKTITDRISEISKKPFEQFDYPHQIKTFDDATQKQLWCLRTLLFYQLLLNVTEMMNTETLFIEVYQGSGSGIKRTFRQDVVPNLKNYKLGIFGSITPASDIDIGIQYSGFNDLIGLAYVVSVFEDSFLIFTGKDSLSFDIETYGDLVTFPDVRDKPVVERPECVNVHDVFPFDISAFTYDNFITVLPFVFAGILRNYVIAKKTTLNDVRELVDQFVIDDFFEVTAQKTGTNMFDFLKKEVPSDAQGEIQEKLTNVLDQAKAIIVKYMGSLYAVSREEYYKLVQTAETSLLNAKKTYFANGKVNMPNAELVNAVKNVSNALVFREESYTNPATVMHVVRVLQANANNLSKYATLEPSYCEINRATDAYCNVGKYGYIISMLEQLGYIYRFHITYCVTDPNGEKCTAKTKKYVDRFQNAMTLYKTTAVTSPATGGRKRKHTTKSNAMKKCKKTRKNKNKKTRANKRRANKTRAKYTYKK